MISGFCDLSGEPAVRGFMHVPEHGNGHGIALTHGAGGDCESRLLRSLAGAFADAGYLVLRLNLPFRQRNPHGPPLPAGAAQDREGLRRAASIMRSQVSGKLWVGGHSYGGRQATILAAENPGLAAGLILFSYPLHPPRKPTQLRTEHFPRLTVPALFVHGSRDPFGLPAEMESALKLIPASTTLLSVEGGGHDLLPKKAESDLPARVVDEFQRFFALKLC
jgi:uncharacterized protein